MPAVPPGATRPASGTRGLLSELQRYGQGLLGAFDEASRMGSQGMVNALRGYDEAGDRMSGILPVTRDPNYLPTESPYSFASSRALELVNTMPVPGGAGIFGAGPALFSNATEAIGKAKFKKGTAQQYLALPGMKKEELEVTGLADWLASHEGKSIERGEVLEYLSQNEVRVGEVMKGEKAAGDDYSLWQNGEEVETGLSFGEAQAAVRQELEAGADIEMRSQTVGLPTKFSQWQLPGGENYRELLLTLPTGKRSVEAIDADLDAILKQVDAEDWGARPDLLAQHETLMNERNIAAGFTGDKTFTGGHYDEPNVLAHIRMNDRVDAEGRKVLFIEEIQSDWHQKGRKQGYVGDTPSDPELLQDLISRRASLNQARAGHEAAGDYARGNELGTEINRLIFDIENLQGSGKVPDAPFKKTWHELAMKRAIRYAAENGYDRVAWTTGAQQADRYDLSKHISGIGYERRGSLFNIRVFGKNGEQVMNNQSADTKWLEDNLGKEMAEKIVKGEGRGEGVFNYIEGLDLQVGGEGMKTFYDRMLPQAATRIGKKYGAVTGKMRLPYQLKKGVKGDEVHSINITGRLRKQAVEKGLPMFSVAPPGALIPSDVDSSAPEIFRLDQEQQRAYRRGEIS